MSQLPIIKLTPFYMGQFGVFGSDSPLGIRWRTDATTWFVDNTHPGCSDDNMGTDPMAPLQTITAAVRDRVGNAIYGNDYDVVVIGGTGYSENVIALQTYPKYVTLLGAGPSGHRPTWAALVTTNPILDVQIEGWRIQGIEFEAPASAAAIRLCETVPNAGDSAYKTIIQDCVFDGLWGGLYGVEFYGAPHRVQILDNWFLELHQGDSSAYAIVVSASPHTNPYECLIARNRFDENDNNVGSVDQLRSFNLSHFIGNVFGDGNLNPTTIMLDFRGADMGDNIVTQNVFCGDYSNPGGYHANAIAPDMWVGNIAEDVAEGEVGDNGFTTLPPAP